MLLRLLTEIEAAGGTVTLTDLERRLGVDRSALGPMITRLRTAGLLGDGELAAICPEQCGTGCSPRACPLLTS